MNTGDGDKTCRTNAYTPAEAAKFLGLGGQTLRVDWGTESQGCALGGKTLIPRSELEQFLSELPSIQSARIEGAQVASEPSNPARPVPTEFSKIPALVGRGRFVFGFCDRQTGTRRRQSRSGLTSCKTNGPPNSGGRGRFRAAGGPRDPGDVRRLHVAARAAQRYLQVSMWASMTAFACLKARPSCEKSKLFKR